MPSSLSRRSFARLVCLTALPQVTRGARRMLGELMAHGDSQEFVHPGMLHSDADLRRMREAVRQKQQPIYGGFERLRDDPHSQLSYKAFGASEEVGRNPTIRANALEGDSNAAYQMALMGQITQDSRYFLRCALILDDWASTLKRITGADAVLCAGLSPFKLANAAELLRAGDGGWPQASVLRFGQFLRGVVLRVIDNFAPFANGNWDTAALKTMTAIAIFLEDRELLDRALVYYLHGCGDGRLEHYIYANGQCQESGRDQQHTQLGLAHMGDCCEMAWHQGLDLYGMMDNRLLLGFEYTARYEVGKDVPFVPDIDQTGKYRHRVISPRSPLRPVYEQIYNHYAMRRGLPTPWTAKAAAQVRPEGPGFGADHTGFGTLLYSRTAAEPIEAVASATPAGLYASDDGAAVHLSWVPLVTPSSYIVMRRGGRGARRIPVSASSGVAEDHTAASHQQYEYRVEVSRDHRRSNAVTAVAALPEGWVVSGVGKEAPPGTAFCSGTSWRLSAAAIANVQVPSGLTLLARHLSPRETVFSATLLPQFASQSLRAGVACFGKDGAAAILLLVPGKGSFAEHVVWAVQLWVREHEASDLVMQHQVGLGEPAVSYGRLYAALGLRFLQSGAAWAAEFSTDGFAWIRVGSCDALHAPLRAGMVLTSGIPEVSTEVMWDPVTVAPGTSWNVKSV